MPTHDAARFRKWIHRKPALFEYAHRLLAEGKHDMAWAKHYLGMRTGLKVQEIEAALAEYKRMLKAGELKKAPVVPPAQKSSQEHKTEPQPTKVEVGGREVAWDPKKGWVYLDTGKKVAKTIAPPPPEGAA
jgi:hypothetical protein